jgi:hypothetical protein
VKHYIYSRKDTRANLKDNCHKREGLEFKTYICIFLITNKSCPFLFLKYCLICNSRNIEDDFHSVCNCNVYNDIRKQYLRSSIYKFDDLMQGTVRNIQLKL